VASVVIPLSAAYPSTLALMTVPLAVWSSIASLELLAVAPAFLPGRPLGTDLAALGSGRLVPALLSSRLSAPVLLPLAAGLRLAAGLVLPVAASAGMTGSAATLLTVVAICTLWLSLVTGGGDGADKIALVACGSGGLIAGGIVADDRLLCLAGLIWGTGQVAIAYATSGLAKLPRGFWRDGSALAAVVTGYRAGHPLAAAIVRRRPLAIALGWTLMLVEALFPLALLAPPPVCLAALATMALFHVATALVMGLNTYPWAFAATYPCAVMANSIIVGSRH
jgi:hypothetical protein